MRYLLDTHILKQLIQAQPPAALMTWMAEQADADLFISSLTVAEIWRSILEQPAGQQRDQLAAWFQGPEGPPALFAGRVLAFDEKAGLIWAQLMAQSQASRLPRNALDALTAAVAQAHQCQLVSGSDGDFSPPITGCTRTPTDPPRQPPAHRARSGTP
jgi:predicted nucleic acid-binding protein